MSTIIDALGGHAAVAAMLNIKAPSIYDWRDGRIPLERCPAIEYATRGLWAVETLRPDCAKRWRRVPDDAWPHPAGRPLLDVVPELGAAEGKP